MKKTLIILALPLALSSCLDRFDYHGADPRAYNERIYPKENRVEFNSVHQSFYFSPGYDTFGAETLKSLDGFTNRAYPSAVDRLVIASAKTDEDRQLYITRLLRQRGFKKAVMESVTDRSLAPEEVVIQMDYSFVVSPDCPDWRKSSDINYSNTVMSNMNCATVTNLGKQVANPKHLIESDVVHVAPDGAVGAAAIGRYRGTASTGDAGSVSSSSTAPAEADNSAAVPAQ